MFGNSSVLAWLFWGTLLCGAALLFYSHMEGNLFSATRSHYDDIRRNMRRRPRYRVWLIAFRMAMGSRRY